MRRTDALLLKEVTFSSITSNCIRRMQTGMGIGVFFGLGMCFLLSFSLFSLFLFFLLLVCFIPCHSPVIHSPFCGSRIFFREVVGLCYLGIVPYQFVCSSD